MEILKKIEKHIKSLKGEIYIVGGSVRDEILGKSSKDLDILVTGVPFEKLSEVLKSFGKVDLVGKSFGVIKWTPRCYSEAIDVAIPRTERKIFDSTLSAHKSFEIYSDHNLPIEADLKRRDFTINAIAKTLDGKWVDPFGGLDDLETKTIKMVDEKAFAEDPLRMLRAVIFSTRLEFDIEEKTLDSIFRHSHEISGIAPERIVMELEKVFFKGGSFNFMITQLIRTGLFVQIFKDAKGSYMIHLPAIAKTEPSTIEEFWLKFCFISDKPVEFAKSLKLPSDVIEFITASVLLIERKDALKWVDAFKISKKLVDSQLLFHIDMRIATRVKSGKLPISAKQLPISGDDFLELGYAGREIGDLQRTLLKIAYTK